MSIVARKNTDEIKEGEHNGLLAHDWKWTMDFATRK